MTRRFFIRIATTLATLMCMAWLATSPAAQNASAEFEAASIKVAPPPVGFQPLRTLIPGRLYGRSNLEGLIRLGYGVEFYEKVTSAPDIAPLLKKDYDINAVLRSDLPREFALVSEATRRMLEDRFAVRVKWDNQEGDVVVLRQSAKGFRLRPFEGDCEPRQPGQLTPISCALSSMNGHVVGVEDLKEFARFTSRMTVDAREVVARGAFAPSMAIPFYDETGLSGRFAFDLTYAPESLRGSINSVMQSNAPAFADAIRDQLGLTMEKARRPIRVLVVEHVGPLVEN